MEFSTLTIALALLANSLMSTRTTLANIQPPAVVSTTQTTEDKVRSYFSDIPVMTEIARCESQFTQYENGHALKGKITPADTGVFQINETYHPDAIGEVETLDGNLAYARKLYEAHGTRDWLASSACWSHAGRTAGVVAVDY